MPREKTAPTRSNLLRLRERLEFAREGHDLLEQKRDVLVTEVMHLISDAEDIEQRAYSQLEQAFATLRKANITMGLEAVYRASLASERLAEVDVKEKSVMGVVVPIITYEGREHPMEYGLLGTCTALDESRKEFKAALALLAEMAEIVVSLMRLADETQKTQRRVNALENIFIPDYEKTIKHIEDTLDEREREDLYAMRLVKKQVQGGR